MAAQMEGKNIILVLDASHSYLSHDYSLSRQRQRIILSSDSDDCRYMDLVVQLFDLLVHILSHQSLQLAFQYYSYVYLSIRYLFQRS